MDKLLRALVLLPLLGLGSCGGEGQDPLPQPVVAHGPAPEYLLGFGETIRFDGLALEFTTLAEDSRCPTHPLVLCASEGNAQILVTARRHSAEAVLGLNTHPRFPTSADFEGLRVTLVKLDPYPTDLPGTPPVASRYVATIRVTRSQTAARNMPGAGSVGRSLKLCTARSARPASTAS